MASSLTADTFYNLSTQHQFNYNKELIFVKLTDSALRAIEEFARNQNKFGSSASIKFSGNEGFLSFPTHGGSNGSNQPVEQKFSFSLADMEGPQGSFECLQQNHGQMNILGALQYKMRIHAQEDVYESTRRSMAQAAQNQKNKCTQEIKPNQTDIGRKNITKKSSSAVTSSIYNRTTTSSQSTPNKLTSKQQRDVDRGPSGGGSDGINNSSNNLSSTNHLSSQQQQSQIPTTNNSLSYNSNNHQDHHDPYHQSNHHHHNALNGVVVGDEDRNLSSAMGHNLNNRNGGQQNHRTPEIVKKPIRERLIHLLALRPFKKPELYDRLTREGIKDRDRSVIGNVLKTISYIRDNTYILHRHIWNDVNEDWPFYSEQDRSTLKRRKPQNLTPPLSSDGGSSSTSGQSPNSQHNGSPPPAVKRPSSQAPSSLNNNINLSNNMINDKYLEPAAKKQRISHYKKTHGGDTAMVENVRSSNGLYDSRDGSSFMNSRSRDNEDFYGSNTTPNSLEDSGLSLSYSVLNTDVSKRIASPMSNGSNGSKMGNERSRNRTNGTNNNNGTSNTTSSSYDTSSTTMVAMSNGDIDGFRVSPSSEKNSTTKNGFSDYPRITTVEQRRKYKTEFDKDYAEYRQLHAIMEKARRRFANLQEELRNVHPSNERKYKEIQNQIIQEYKENNNNSSFKDKKQRFEYLHEKLSHIKKLVSDFDSQLTKGNVNGDSQPAHATY